MILLNNKDVRILHDGINKLFNIWHKSSSDISTNELIVFEMINQGQFPNFWKLDTNTQWDLMCALYYLYQSNIIKSKSYNNSDITKVSQKITGRLMKATISALDTALQDNLKSESKVG